MNLPEKLKLVKCSKDYPYKFILANTQESVTIDARKLGAEEQLKADQETYTQALEKIKELEAIEESHRKLNGELRERIKGLEETKGTYSQSTIKLLERIKDLEEKYDNAEEAINSLFKQLGDAIHKACELEELIPTKEEAESIINALDENYSGDKEIIAKLQKIMDKGQNK